ncbi:MAG: DUF167 family protein [Candidatus Omnitrophica bacterium]|nr:DUF167 family protein [Candidatus Omnitrophota bacterium]
MKISVIVKTNSKKEKVEKIDEKTLRVYVKEPAKENRANKAVIELLSDYFQIPKAKISIVAGIKAKYKLIEIYEL